MYSGGASLMASVTETTKLHQSRVGISTLLMNRSHVWLECWPPQNLKQKLPHHAPNHIRECTERMSGGVWSLCLGDTIWYNHTVGKFQKAGPWLRASCSFPVTCHILVIWNIPMFQDNPQGPADTGTLERGLMEVRDFWGPWGLPRHTDGLSLLKSNDESHPIPQIPYFYFNTKTYFLLNLPQLCSPSENCGVLFFFLKQKSSEGMGPFH